MSGRKKADLIVPREEFNTTLQKLLATKPLKRGDVKPVRKRKHAKRAT